MNYYPFHIGDFASATRHLSWDEDAAYRRLLDAYYTREAPLPTDLRAVYRLVVATTDSQRAAVEVVIQEFFTLTADGWVNKRADQEIAAMREKQQKQRDKANKRWHKPAAEHGNAPAMPRPSADDAAASEIDAAAMPPTPTPTPTPTPEEKKGSARKRAPPAAAVVRPHGVQEQTWADWLTLRKAKRAPVTQTVLDAATSEAAKAGMPLEGFLRVWCGRGSQGLEAAWLKANELAYPVTVPSAEAAKTAAYLAEKSERGREPRLADVAEKLAKAKQAVALRACPTIGA